jgi:WD40 repeat protein
MHLAHDFFWKNGDVGGMLAQLARHIPDPGDEDNRGFAWHYLEDLSRRSESRTLRGHAGEVFSVAFAPDGRTVASAGADGTIRLWDATALSARGVWHAHQGAVRAITFAPDGRLLASAGDDGAVRLWDAADGSKRGDWVGHVAGVLCLAFAPDGKRLVSGGRDCHVRLWTVATGRELASRRYEHEVSGVAFVADGTTVGFQVAGVGIMSWAPDTAGPPSGLVPTNQNALCFATSPVAGEAVVGYTNGHVLWHPPQKNGAPATFHGSPRAVRALAVSPDGWFVAAGSDDATVRIWDRVSSVARFVGKGHRGPVRAVAFAPDGKGLATAGADGMVKLWDQTAPQDYDTVRPDVVAAGRAAFAADGGTMALACTDETVRILDPVTWRERSRFASAGFVRALALSGDGTVAASSDGRRIVQLWDTRTGRAEATLPAAYTVECLALSPDGRLLAEGCAHGAVHLRKPASASAQAICVFPDPVRAVAFSADGSTLAAAGATLLLWDVAAGKQRARLTCRAVIQSLAFTHDGRTLITCDTDHRLAFWSIADPGSPRFIDSAANAPSGPTIAISPDDCFVAVADCSHIRLFDLKTHALYRRLAIAGETPFPRGIIVALGFGRERNRVVSVSATGRVVGWNLSRRTLDSPGSHALAGVHSLAFLPDGRTLLTGSGEWPADTTRYTWFGLSLNYRRHVEGNTSGAVRLWDTISGRQRAALPLPGGVRLCCLAVAPDGRTAAGGCSGGVVRLWDLRSVRERLTLFTNEADEKQWRRIDGLLRWGLPGQAEFRSAVRAVAFSPDSRLLVTANDDGRVRLWDAASGAARRTVCADHPDTTCLAFSPDGAVLAMNRARAVELWDVAAGRLLRTLDGHAGAVSALAWSADGRLLASGGADQVVKLWDPRTGRERSVLVGHHGPVSALAFCPDGRTLASGGHDQAVRLWQIATGQELFALTTTYVVAAVAFAPDGRTLAAGGDEPPGRGAVFLWRATGLSSSPGQ